MQPIKNEEMAKSLVGSKSLSSMITTADFEKLAVEMAEWKDKQYAKAFASILIELVELDRSNKESFNNLRIEYIQNHPEYKNMPFVPMYRHIDYLNTYHFDYRGLIPMGLALPATEGMYKF